MEDNKCSYYIGEQEAMQIVESIFMQEAYSHKGVLFDKLNELFQDRIRGVLDGKYATYLSTYGIQEVSTMGCCGYRDNLRCEKNGWNWDRISSYSSQYYLNQTNYFCYDCSFFTKCYAVYIYSKQEEESFEELLKKSAEEFFEDINSSVYSNTQLELYDECITDEQDRDDYKKLLVYGAWYIDSWINGFDLAQETIDVLGAMYDAIEGANTYVTAVEYFDSFFSKIKESLYEWSDGVTKALMPYATDCMLGMKEFSGMAPELYFYKSRGMNEFRALRQKNETHPYVRYLDALVKFLEDPALVESVEDEEHYLVAPYEIVNNCTVSTLSFYTQDEYFRIYYYFDCEGDEEDGERTKPLGFSPLFYVARRAFDVLLEVMKKDLISGLNETVA